MRAAAKHGSTTLMSMVMKASNTSSSTSVKPAHRPTLLVGGLACLRMEITLPKGHSMCGKPRVSEQAKVRTTQQVNVAVNPVHAPGTDVTQSGTLHCT
jgi:hypothetical protein